MYEHKKIWKVFTSKFVGTGPSSYKKRIYRAAVSQRLRNTGVRYLGTGVVSISSLAFIPGYRITSNSVHVTVDTVVAKPKVQHRWYKSFAPNTNLIPFHPPPVLTNYQWSILILTSHLHSFFPPSVHFQCAFSENSGIQSSSFHPSYIPSSSHSPTFVGLIVPGAGPSGRAV